MMLDLPKIHKFGENEVTELKYLEDTFKINHRTALKYLRSLRIQPLYIGNEIYFSLSTFNRIMFVLSRPGAPGFLFPGSKHRNDQALKKRGYLTTLSDELLQEAMSPSVLAEMAAASGRDVSMVKKLISQETAKIRKKPKKDEP